MSETPEEMVARIAAKGKKPKRAGGKKPQVNTDQKRKPGRPPKEPNVDEPAIGNLASIMCTMKEIALITGLSVDTLERRFADVIEKGRAEGRMSLRRQQFKVAMAPMLPGSATMLVWLGKTVLGQRETVVHVGEDPILDLLAAMRSGDDPAPVPPPA